MGRLWKEKPLKFLLKFLINSIYGISIFGIFIITFVRTNVIKLFIPPEYLGYLSGLLVIFQTLKKGLEKIDPKLKDDKKDSGPSSTIRMG